jgi:4-hydroxybenzoyl-CoA thioesterase
MTTDLPSHRFERDRTIRFSHCDPAGIVFFPQYLVMFNDLVEEWISVGLGVPYDELLGRRRTGLPTASLHCEFKAVSRMGDAVTLWLAPARIGRASLQLKLGCHAAGQVRVEVAQTVVFTNLETHRPIPIPDDLRQAMLAFAPNP